MSGIADQLEQLGQQEASLEARLTAVAGPSVEARRAATVTAVVGMAHALLLVAAFVLVRSGAPGASASDAELVEFYSDSDNRRQIVAAGLYLIPFSAIAFIWFVVSLRMWMASGSKRISPLLANVQLAAGIVYVTLILASGATFSVLAATYELTNDPIAPTLGREFPRLGSILFLTLAMRMAAMVVFTTSSIGRAAGLLPRWFVIIGFVVGITLLLSASLSPLLILVFPTWLLILSCLLFIRARQIPSDVVIQRTGQGAFVTAPIEQVALSDPQDGSASAAPAADSA